MATALDPFSMFTLTTGPAFLKSSTSIINATTFHSYLLPRFMEGKDTEFLLQGGQKIQDILYLEEDTEAEFYAADKQDFTYRNQQVGTAWEVNWRFLVNRTSWTDHEVGLNENGTLSDRIGAFHRFKRYRDLKLMNLFTTTIHKVERQLTAEPSNSEMEAARGVEPYCIYGTVTDRNDGLPDGFSAVQGIAPSDKPNWDNQRELYTVAAGSVTPEELWGGFRKAWHRARFERLPRFGQYSEPTRSPQFIMCSLWGLMLAESNMRSEQDLFLGARRDPAWPGMMFENAPLVYVDTLDANTTGEPDRGVVYTDPAGGGGYANEQGTQANTTPGSFIQGPRYTFAQGRCLNLIFHKDRVFKRLPPFSPDRQPMMKVLVTDTWYNMTNQNRREHAILSPTGTDLTTPSAPLG